MLVNGKEIFETYAEMLEFRAARLPSKRVAFVLFGNNTASEKFVERKMKFAERLDVQAVPLHLQIKDTNEAVYQIHEILEKYDGIVIQLPLPDALDTQTLLNVVPVSKDIDMLSEEAKVWFKEGKTKCVPPVAYAVHTILSFYNIPLEQKEIVLLGKGKLVGEPIAMLFDRLGISYKAIDIHTPTEERDSMLLSADIIISGIGVPHSILPSMIKDGAVLIDAGTSEQEGKLVGDIHPDCEDKASLYTPVPGGVGPLTVLGLFNNLFLE
jgi:methylenetetrahydrofolate dehydrogenase (NADP+) / methenyltetrahydrofolate cyclohydrolase